MPSHIIIPARFLSSRLPGKALLPIQGKPMLLHVIEAALQVKDVASVTVATDDTRIANVTRKANCKVIFTDQNHRNGTERVAEAARILDLPLDDVVLNLQSDMPYIFPWLCELVIKDVEFYEVATAAVEVNSTVSSDPSLVKVVMNSQDVALYFSRKPIATEYKKWNKHLGLYAMANSTLQKYADTKPSCLEVYEDLEQLRWYDMGIFPGVILTTRDCPSVNNQFDYEQLTDPRIEWPNEQITGHVI